MQDNLPFEKAPSLKVNQGFSDFYLVSLPAKKLVSICYSFPAMYGDDSLTGVQRAINGKRVDDIAKFCLTEKVLFPNSIILSANILENGDVASEENQWFIDENSNLVIPSSQPLASIVDGQHRIEGLKRAIEKYGLDEDIGIVCAVYFDLPAPQQAEIFATVNFNQQKVDKSLAYQLFGYDLDTDDSKYWSPDTLAIYLTRLLDKEENSPFQNRISFGMEKTDNSNSDWSVSTSVVVEGITKLITSNPTKDRYELHKKRLIRRGRDVLNSVRSKAPLRDEYTNYNDGQIYDLIFSFFSKVNDKLWKSERASFMHKTIGVQALFDLLKEICIDYENGIPTDKHLNECIDKIDLEILDALSVNFSGIGRTQIRKELLQMIFQTD